jgi:hypothetical protein
VDHTVDSEIHHLERVLTLEIAHQVFSADYWRSRVLQVGMTPGLIPHQRRRLQQLLELIDHAEQRKRQSRIGAGEDRTVAAGKRLDLHKPFGSPQGSDSEPPGRGCGL